jgi:septal ring factor EnvC (AmiA/AmiB activator)
MKNGIKQTLCILFSINVILINSMSQQCYCKNLSELKTEAASIQKKSSETNALIKHTKEKKVLIQKEIDSVDQKLLDASEELLETSNKLNETEKKLSESTEKLSVARKEKEKQHDMCKKRMRSLYENGKNSYVKLLLDSHDFSEFIKRCDYINYILQYDTKAFNNLQNCENIIQTELQNIQEKHKQIEKLVSEKQECQDNLEKMLEQKRNTMENITQDLDKYKKQLDELEISSCKIEKMIKQAEIAKAAELAKANAKRSVKKDNNASNVNNTNNNGTNNKICVKYTAGKLLWPVPGKYLISSGYGSRTNPISKRTEFHSGIDIPAPTGTKIIAADTATVVYAGNINGYGLTIILNHGEGISTLYGHNSKLCVVTGQCVQRGATIALAGSTGYSTGSHCHFEVRVNGKHTNPNNYIK